METKSEIPDETKTDALLQLREEINRTDAQLLKLLNQRAELSLAVGDLKRSSGIPVYMPAREKELLAALLYANNGPLQDEHILSVYREILSASRALQRPLRVAFLGPEGTFSHMAALEYFGAAINPVPLKELHEVFEAVSGAKCDLGMVPLENSLYGGVAQSLDLFARHDVQVLAEHFARIRLCLMSTEQSLEAVHKVYSHPQPLGQCAEWLRYKLPQASQMSQESTAVAAERASTEQGSAAIGHGALAQRLHLNILADGIEDAPDNWTRFLVISAQTKQEENANKSSLVFVVADKPGSLAKVLEILSRRNINMTKLESRPVKGEAWKHFFFADVDQNLNNEENAGVLAELREYCLSLRFLGAYPAARPCSFAMLAGA